MPYEFTSLEIVLHCMQAQKRLVLWTLKKTMVSVKGGSEPRPSSTKAGEINPTHTPKTPLFTPPLRAGVQNVTPNALGSAKR